MTTANKTIKINDIEAAKKLVSAAVRCPFDIDIVSKGKIFIDAKSILGVLSLSPWSSNTKATMRTSNPLFPVC